MNDDDLLLSRFLDNTIDLDGFDHAQHVRVTYLLLRDRPLPETMIALRDSIRRIAARAGHPEKYHETITFAFAAIVNERMQRSTARDWTAFSRENGDLLQWKGSSVLNLFYDRQMLSKDDSRRTFLLPR